MLTCIARSKQPGDESLSQADDAAAAANHHPSAAKQQQQQQAIKSLTSQLKDMALKASGAYRHCNPCTAPTTTTQSQLRNNSTESDAEF
ncbi:PROTEIN BREVIS RADIX-LIKE 1 [Salix viminalis]|nr:PROTEIN BREVIS RADIX-LIKE 1 [Salix viminalis]